MSKSMNVALFGLVAVALLLAPSADAAEAQRVLAQDDPRVERTIEGSGTTFLGQAPNQANGIFSDADCDFCPDGQQTLSEDFMVSTGGLGANINQITIWGGYYPDNISTPGDLEVIFHSETPPTDDPGAPVCQYTVTPTSHTATGAVLFGVDEYEVVLDFADCTLADGAYSVEIYANTVASTDSWFWEEGNLDGVNGVLGSYFAFETPGVTWSRDLDSDLATMMSGVIVPVELQSFSIE